MTWKKTIKQLQLTVLNLTCYFFFFFFFIIFFCPVEMLKLLLETHSGGHAHLCRCVPSSQPHILLCRIFYRCNVMYLSVAMALSHNTPLHPHTRWCVVCLHPTMPRWSSMCMRLCFAIIIIPRNGYMYIVLSFYINSIEIIMVRMKWAQGWHTFHVQPSFPFYSYWI